MNIHLQVIFSFHMFSPYQGLDLWISPSLINAQRSQGRAHCGLWNAWPIPLTNNNPSSSIPTCDSLLWISYLRMIYLISLPVWLRFKFKVQRSMAWSILKSRPATSSFWWYRWVRDLIYLYIYIHSTPQKDRNVFPGWYKIHWHTRFSRFLSFLEGYHGTIHIFSREKTEASGLWLSNCQGQGCQRQRPHLAVGKPEDTCFPLALPIVAYIKRISYDIICNIL